MCRSRRPGSVGSSNSSGSSSRFTPLRGSGEWQWVDEKKKKRRNETRCVCAVGGWLPPKNK